MHLTRAFQFKLSGPALLLLAGTTVLLNGCALNGGSGSSAKAVLSAAGAHTIGGIVHGGQNPVTGATVILWAAGTTGTYGTGATNVASTTTDGNGNFSLDNSSGVSPCTTGQYLYLTATGGNSGAGTNNYIAMMAALPTPCSATTGATTVFIDEVTTIAAVTALQQFMSIASYTPPYTGTGTVPWTIGAPSTNTTGLANAFLESATLAFTSTGTTGESFPTNTVNSLVYTTTINPDSQRINGLADILAVCINDTSGNNCTGSAGVLTLTTIATGASSPTYSVPVDTIQAAYNMATLPNPSLYSGAKYWKNSTSSTTYLSTLWANINTQAPFQPYATLPTDTTIGVQWRTTNPSGGTVGTVYAGSIAVDASGNIWTASEASQTASFVNQYNQAGQLLQDVTTAAIPSYTLTYYADTATAVTASTTANASATLANGSQFSLAIDTNNNAWFGATAGVSPGNLTTNTLVTGITAQITQSGVVTGYLAGSAPGPIAIDGNNNIFLDEVPTSGRWYLGELPASGSYETVYEGIGRNSHNYPGLAVDSNNYVWAFYSVCSTPFVVARTNSATMISSSGTGTASTAGNVTIPSNCLTYGAGDANGNMWATDGTSLLYVNIGSSLTAPTVTTSFTGNNTTGTTGLYNPYGLAVDGSGNVWVANKGVVNSVAGAAEFSTNGTTGAVTLLSPAGTGVAGFGSASNGFSLDAGTPENVAIDSSGNVWFATVAGSFLYHIVGAASPVKTPLASMYAHIGTRP
jgi:sugar lactone lactonase YvrE